MQPYAIQNDTICMQASKPALHTLQLAEQQHWFAVPKLLGQRQLLALPK